MDAENRLKELGIIFKQVNNNGKGVVPIRRYGNLLFVSGHGQVDENGEPLIQGCVELDLNEQQAYEAARQCAVIMLRYLGDLDRIEEWVKVLGLVNSGGDYCGMLKAINSFSDLIVTVFYNTVDMPGQIWRQPTMKPVIRSWCVDIRVRD
jgi:hypothetical protein